MSDGIQTLASFDYFEDNFSTYRIVVKNFNGKVFIGDCKWGKPNNSLDTPPRGYCYTPAEAWEDKLKAFSKVSDFLKSPKGKLQLICSLLQTLSFDEDFIHSEG